MTRSDRKIPAPRFAGPTDLADAGLRGAPPRRAGEFGALTAVKHGDAELGSFVLALPASEECLLGPRGTRPRSA
jgi:hypothetical protein